MKFDMFLSTTAAKASVKLQSDTIILTPNLVALRLYESDGKMFYSCMEYSPRKL